jgi:hypothetical protein|tara:strand:- start:72 stop:431 length:360 start_codon:yes stop_codon:yes gene_type:complete
VISFLTFLKFSQTFQKSIEKEIDQRTLSSEELHQIIKSLDEGIVIQKHIGDKPTGDPLHTQYFTNGFLDAIFRFALEDDVPAEAFTNNTELMIKLMHTKIFQLDHDQNHELACKPGLGS